MDDLDTLILETLKDLLKQEVSALLPEIMADRAVTPASCADGLRDAFVAAGARLILIVGVDETARLLRTVSSSATGEPSPSELDALTKDVAYCLESNDRGQMTAPPAALDQTGEALRTVFEANPRLRVLSALWMFASPDSDCGTSLAEHMRVELDSALRAQRSLRVH